VVGFVIVLGASSGSARAATESCAAGTTLNIVAHEDDDLLFLNPSVLHDVQCGRRVVTVYATAGDAGQDSSYWLDREMGAEAAYADMAGTSDSWTATTLTKTDGDGNSHLMQQYTLDGDSNVSLVFMRLPDGRGSGDGFASTGYQSLKKLWESSAPYTYQIDSLGGGSSAYTRPELVEVLTALMDEYQPDTIRTQDYVGAFGGSDHSDHYAVARFVNLAQLNYSTAHTFAGYMGYGISQYPQNVAGTDLAAKESAFFSYSAFDASACASIEACSSTEYMSWLTGEYQIGTPRADAGPDQTVATVGATVHLDGSASSDPDGAPITYSWAQTGGSAVALSDTSSPTPTFTAPAAATILTFALTVSDGSLASTDSVIVTVAPNSANIANQATLEASSENTALGKGKEKAVDGFTDGDPLGNATHEWATVGGRAGSWLKLTWSSARVIDRVVLYDRPNENDQITGGTLSFSDGSTVAVPALANGGSPVTISFSARSTTSLRLAIDSVSTTTENIGLAEIEVWTPADHAPVADAGHNQTVDAGSTATLDGSASSDPDSGDTLSYSWEQTGGTPTVSLDSTNPAKPSFTAPASANTLTFKLTVSDGTLSNSSSVTITVNHAPVADAGLDQSVSTGATVTLDGSKSSDPDGDALSYKWEQTGGSPVTLSSAVAAKPSFTAPAGANTLTFKLTVSDGSLTGSDSVKIAVVKPEHAPVANAGSDQKVRSNVSVTLDGSASSDPDHDPITYEWEQTGGPRVTLSSAVAARPSFTAPAAGRLIFKLTVSDGSLTSSDSVTIGVSKGAKPALKKHTRPQTTLLKMKIRSAKRIVIFRFKGSGGKGKLSFQCRLDTQRFSRCRVYKTYKHLGRGRHVFRVRARDTSGLADLTLVTKRFKI
jgi:LmbE family N-acetylglucosaminyl deacetylase